MRSPLALRRDRGTEPRSLALAVVGPPLLAGAIVLIALGLISAGAGYEIVILFGINAIMVVGFQVFVGNTGIMSFGHVGFMALGAYAAGIVSLSPELKQAFLPNLPGFMAGTTVGMLPSLLIGGAVAAAFALVVGAVILRLSGSAATITTFALLVIVNEVLSNASTFTRGTQTFSGVPETTNSGWVFGCLIVAVVIAAAAKWSWIGLQARAVREDMVAASASGISVLPGRVLLFALSAFITGVGGALWAHFLTAFSPASFYLPQVVGIVVMAILGGINSVSGAIVGAAALSAINELLRRGEAGFSFGVGHFPSLPGLAQLVLGVGLILLLRWRPEGIFGSYEVALADPAKRRTDGG